MRLILVVLISILCGKVTHASAKLTTNGLRRRLAKVTILDADGNLYHGHNSPDVNAAVANEDVEDQGNQTNTTAAVVGGVLAVLALTIIGVLFWRRRRSSASSSVAKDTEEEDNNHRGSESEEGSSWDTEQDVVEQEVISPSVA